MSVFCASLFAQSLTTGDITGTVTDPSGSNVPNAAVTIVNTGTNVTQKAATGSDGTYRFAFLPSGTYTVTIAASGFQTQERRNITVSAGQPTAVDVQLVLAGAATTVNVVETTSVLQTENADTKTTFSADTIRDLPNPGGDITYVAQTAPGVVMNTQAGYGNFVADGMPGISNLFSINGQNFNDPFQGINNSGASNLLLGANDIAEANVITNGYSAQYGQYAGSQIIYITKSGTNQFHANANYMWNGRAMNANQFFSNLAGLPTPFNNYNQWAVGAQGPIWKNKTFFDADYEGVRNLLPTAANESLVPSPQFESATLANLAAMGRSSEIPFYNQVFAIYNHPFNATATPVPQSEGGGCPEGFDPLAAGVPCAYEFRTTPTNLNKEYQWSGRVDHNFSDKDHAYVRVWRDSGFQPTFTSPFGPTFNAQSNQPQMSAQIAENHIFGPNTVNQFNASSLFYAAVFVASNPTGALAALPTFLGFSGNAFTGIGAYAEPAFPPTNFYFPEGRRVFQYQVSDDLSHVMGRHTFRAGVNWIHETITDLDFGGVGGPIYGGITTSVQDFYNGGGPATSLNQAFPTSAEESIRLNTLGGYVVDDWKVTDHLTVSMNLRFEHYANPTCDASCFSRLPTAFTGAANPNAANIPYDQLMLSNQKDAFANTQAIVIEPRLGIAWKPFHNDNTVVRTGAGIFADQIPGGLTENAAFNSPGFNAFFLGNPNGLIAPGVAGSLFTTAAQANQALLSQFKSGGTFNSISASVPGFSAPNINSFPNTFYQPTYYKWNFEVQQALGWGTVASANYSGMHGYHLPVSDQGLNAYCPTSVCTSGFVGLPTTAPNAAFGLVNQYLSAGVASYNGLTLSLQKRMREGLTFTANYTWSHALDDVSNGGISNEQFSILATDQSISSIENPHNVAQNYASSDYDVRHYFSASFVQNDVLRHLGFKWGQNRIFGGWTIASNWFLRSGLPFTIVDNSAAGALVPFNFGGPIFASAISRVPATCGNAVDTPCLTTAEFAPAAANTASGAPTGFGRLGRNTVYGPHFFNVDLAVMKEVQIRERLTFSFGMQAYNLFNHVNFDQPVNDISNPLFGTTIAAVGPPTSLLGSFVGAGSSPRFIELKGSLRF
ncbi:MAG TPA: carboxypeptidase regulatory-like domain-containing protein [Bryobacteraceae bacterium]|nr:carboxypeptidase regulatory-like domain-containing protein [Bryobacteraceae bacterium]